MTDFVAQYCFHFVSAHLLHQTGADSDQGMVAAGAGREGIRFWRMVNSNFWHPNPSTLGLAADRFHQPQLGLSTRLLNDLGAYRHFRNPLGHEKRDQGAAHAENG